MSECSQKPGHLGLKKHKHKHKIHHPTFQCILVSLFYKLIFQLDQRSIIIMSELFVFERKSRLSISILFMLMQNDLCYLGYWEEEEEEVHINIHQICSPDPILPSPGWIFTNFVRQFYQKFCQAILSKAL